MWIILLFFLPVIALSCENCFQSPSGCSDADCVVSTEWSEYGSAYNITISALVAYFSLLESNEYWVGLGISSTGTMQDSHITLCTLCDNKVAVVQVTGYSHGVTPVSIGSTLTSKVSLTKDDNFVTCQFLLHKSLLKDDSNYFFIGAGSVQDSSIIYHQSTPIASTEMYSLAGEESSSGGVVGITDSRILLHASAMITGYGIFLVIGIYTSRYLKPIFEEAWYRIHTNIIVAMVLIVSVGIAAIFFRQRAVVVGFHELIGFTILGLTVVQIGLGACRPHKKHRYRALYTYTHLFLACTLFFLVIVNIFMGLSKSSLKVPSHIFVIQGIYVIWVVFGSIVGSEVLKHLYGGDPGLYVRKLKVYTLINIGIILLYGCTVIILLNVVE